MEKLKGLLLKINIPMIAFLGFLIKCSVLTPGYADAIIMIAVSAVYTYNLIINKHKVFYEDSLRKEVAEIKKTLSTAKAVDSVVRMNETKKRFF